MFFFNLFFTRRQILGLSIGLVGSFLLLYQGSLTGDSNIFFAIFIILTTVGYGTSVNLIKTYLNNNDFSSNKETFIKLLYPFGVLLVLWSFKVFNK